MRVSIVRVGRRGQPVDQRTVEEYHIGHGVALEATGGTRGRIDYTGTVRRLATAERLQPSRDQVISPVSGHDRRPGGTDCRTHAGVGRHRQYVGSSVSCYAAQSTVENRSRQLGFRADSFDLGGRLNHEFTNGLEDNPKLAIIFLFEYSEDVGRYCLC